MCFAARGVHDGRIPRYNVRNHSSNTKQAGNMNWGISKGFKPSNLPFIGKKLSEEVNERFFIYDNNSSLPINVGAASFSKSSNCKQVTFTNTIVFLTIG